MVVVIPCRDEPDLVASLRSLHECEAIVGGCEVIVVVNDVVEGDAGAANAASVSSACAWFEALEEPGFVLHVVNVALPKKKAGVGLARKVGMDEAVRRVAQVGRLNAGVVACFDADCRCDPGLLVEMENLFRKRPEMPGCSVRFEHPLDAENSEAIILYELHLRYYIEACRYSGHPFAFHAVGSSMAVRAEAYVAQGGMNQRQAGEDFYFLQKIISLGNFGELNSTRVIPSPRVSDRVPFGTGRAVGEFLQGKGGRMESYPFEAFEDLKIFFGQICEKNDTVEGGLAEPLQGFLGRIGFAEALRDIRSQTTSDVAFRKRFFRWFDAFKLMKFVHHARDHSYGAPDVVDVARRLWALLTDESVSNDPRQLLERFRERQCKGWRSPLE